MVELPDDIEQQLASMSDAEWDVLVAKVRAPDQAEAFRDTASKWISGDRLNAVCALINASQYVGEDGAISEAKVEQTLRMLFDIPRQGPQWQNFGQGSAELPTPGPGERGTAEAQKRFGRPQPVTTGKGSGGAAEAAKRFGKADN